MSSALRCRPVPRAPTSISCCPESRIWADWPEPTGVVSFAVDGADPGMVAAHVSAGPRVACAQLVGRWQPVDDPHPPSGAHPAPATRAACCGPRAPR